MSPRSIKKWSLHVLEINELENNDLIGFCMAYSNCRLMQMRYGRPCVYSQKDFDEGLSLMEMCHPCCPMMEKAESDEDAENKLDEKFYLIKEIYRTEW